MNSNSPKYGAKTISKRQTNGQQSSFNTIKIKRNSTSSSKPSNQNFNTIPKILEDGVADLTQSSLSFNNSNIEAEYSGKKEFKKYGYCYCFCCFIWCILLICLLLKLMLIHD
jgi:hypothetical protein